MDRLDPDLLRDHPWAPGHKHRSKTTKLLRELQVNADLWGPDHHYDDYDDYEPDEVVEKPVPHTHRDRQEGEGADRSIWETIQTNYRIATENRELRHAELHKARRAYEEEPSKEHAYALKVAEKEFCRALDKTAAHRERFQGFTAGPEVKVAQVERIPTAQRRGRTIGTINGKPQRKDGLWQKVCKLFR